MDPKTLALLKLAAALPPFLKAIDTGELKDLAQRLVDALKPELPTKADGTPYSDEEIAAVLAQAEAHDNHILESRGATEDDGA